MNFLDDLLFFIYPKSCGICKKIENNFLCEKCERKLKTSELFVNRIIDYEKDRTKYFDEHAFVFKYDSIIRDKIIQYKFNNKAYLSKMFFEFFVKNKKICGFLKKYDIIIPVPMTYKKIKERGYNQTQLIARLITENIESLTLKEDILIKYKENNTQSKLTKQQRVENVKDVYKLRNNKIIKGKNVLIFDDVYTTGATCNECAKTLIKANTNKIGVMTIAKDYNKTQKID